MRNYFESYESSRTRAKGESGENNKRKRKRLALERKKALEAGDSHKVRSVERGMGR